MSADNSTADANSNNHNHKDVPDGTVVVVVCAAPIVQRLADGRIPTHYVGRRRTTTTTTTKLLVRGESNRVRTQDRRGVEEGRGGSGGPDVAQGDGTSLVRSSTITYKIRQSDGTERRMTRQEKKAARKNMVEEKKRKAVAIETALKQQPQEDPRETLTTKRQKFQGAIPPAEDNHNHADNNEDESLNVRTGPLQSLDDPQQLQRQLLRKAYHQGSHTSNVDEILVEEHPDQDEDGELVEEHPDDQDEEGEDGRPPVLLSPSLAYLASEWLLTANERISSHANNSLTPHGSTTNSNNTTTTLQYDHALSQLWATSLKESMRPAETVRTSEEGLRPMAYQLIPEVWTRVRPERHICHPRVFHTKLSPAGKNGSWEFPLAPKDTDLPYDDPLSLSRQEDGSSSSSLSWVALPWRQPTTMTTTMTVTPPHNNDHHHHHGGWDWTATATTAVLEYLHKETDYHWSCGAKFGADFLLYDGPRSQRHAFAGLRIVVVPPTVAPTTTKTKTTATATARGARNDDPPEDNVVRTAAAATGRMPSAYEWAAYVRCLNTAGKLALVATVIMDKTNDLAAAGERGGRSRTILKVAFVDVALEKILTAPTHQRYGRSETRRDVVKNLAKKN